MAYLRSLEEVRDLLFPGLRAVTDTLTDWVARGERVKAAHEKGLALLRSWLSPEQLSDFDKHGHFYAVGSISGIKYRIRQNAPFNIDVMSGEEVVKQLCFGPEGIEAMGDAMLAQKLALELREDEALSVTNTRPPGSLGYGGYGG